MFFSTSSSKKKKKEKKLKGILRRRTDGEKKCIAMLVEYYDENQDKSLSKDEMKKIPPGPLGQLIPPQRVLLDNLFGIGLQQPFSLRS